MTNETTHTISRFSYSPILDYLTKDELLNLLRVRCVFDTILPSSLAKMLWSINGILMRFDDYHALFTWSLSKYVNLDDYVHVWVNRDRLRLKNRPYYHRNMGGHHYSPYNETGEINLMLQGRIHDSPYVALPDSPVKVEIVQCESEQQLIDIIESLDVYD